MNILDIVLLLIVVVPGLISGLKKGFIFQAVTLVAIYVGALLSYKFAETVGRWLGAHVEMPDNVLKIISFAVIFLIVYFILYLLGKLIEKICADIFGGWINKLLGAVLGMFKYAVFAGLAIIVFNTINAKFGFVSRDTLDASVIYCQLDKFANFIFPYLKNLITNTTVV